MIDATLVRKHMDRLIEVRVKSYSRHTKKGKAVSVHSYDRLPPPRAGVADPGWMNKSAVKVGGVEWQVFPQNTWQHREFKLSVDATGRYVLRKNNTKWATYDSMEAASKTVAFYYNPGGR